MKWEAMSAGAPLHAQRGWKFVFWLHDVRVGNFCIRLRSTILSMLLKMVESTAQLCVIKSTLGMTKRY